MLIDYQPIITASPNTWLADQTFNTNVKLTLGSVDTYFDGTSLVFSRNANVAHFIAVVNTTAGTVARTFLQFEGSGLTGSVGVTNGSFTTNGNLLADMMYIQAAATASAGLLIEALAGNIRVIPFANLGIGSGVSIDDQFVNIEKDQNAATFLNIANTTAGTLARAAILFQGSGLTGQVGVTNGSFTTNGNLLADMMYIQAAGTASAGLLVEALAGPVIVAPTTHVILKTGAAPNGQAVNIKTATGTKTTASGTGTETIANAIPAGAVVLGVTARVTTILAGTSLTTWSIGLSVDTDRWGTGLALAAGTTTTGADFATDVQPTVYPAATDLVLTAAAGQFDSGVIRYTVHYYDFTAATS